MDCNLPDSSVHGIFPPRTLEQVVISSSRGSFWLRDQTRISCGRTRVACIGRQTLLTPSHPGKPVLSALITIWAYLFAFWRRQWHPTPVLLSGKSHGRRNLVGCSPWGCKESDTTERLHFHFSLSCIGEGNDNPFQYSCLENPRGGGAWWAAVYGVAQSRTWLKQLSRSSSSLCSFMWTLLVCCLFLPL